MEIQLQDLIEQIKKDGVEAAETQAEAILKSAKAEAEKIKYVLDMVTNTDKNAYGEDGVFKSVDDIISVAMDSKVAGAVIVDLAYDETGDVVIDALGIADSISNEDRELISDALQNYRDEKKDTVSPEEYERINKIDAAICSLILGMK